MRLGKYDVLEEIGRGGMGVVYRGFDEVLRRRVAIKTIQKGDSDEFAARLLNEARAAAHLQHPNIVEIYDFGQDQDTLYIVMELLEGESLRREFIRRRLGSGEFLNILRGVAAALDFAHLRGVIHRDLKPSNIMVLPDGRPKLMDFGVAQVQSLGRMTMTGTMLGTPQYMSPEQIRGESLDGRSDQFALSAIAYEGLTGHPPFDADAIPTVLYKITSGETPSALSQNPDLTPAADDALRRGMAPAAAKRYGSCAEFVEGLAAGFSTAIKLPGPAAPIHMRDRTAEIALPAPSQPQAAGAATHVRTPHALPAVTLLADAAPPSFVDAFPKTAFFSGDQVRFSKIEESFRFFRDNLQKQYESLSRQADVVWKLWAACVGIGFLVLATGLVFLFVSNGEGAVTKGVVTAAASALVYYIQRLFQQREDHYRRAAEEKNSHLEYGNKWLLVIQTVDAIQDLQERKRQQARVAEALTEQLRTGSVKKPPAPRAKRANRGG
ncbi:MAG: serine/threonine protein kinase [Acidobacteriota bacterium]|nr:serine/threonine protein kinase [Acidobacteriota bacterium]